MKTQKKPRPTGSIWLKKYQMKNAARKLFRAFDQAGIDAEKIILNQDGTYKVIDSKQAAADDLMEAIEDIPGFRDSLDAAMIAAGEAPINTDTTNDTTEMADMRRAAAQGDASAQRMLERLAQMPAVAREIRERKTQDDEVSLTSS